VKQWETDALNEKHWMHGFNKFMPLVRSATGQQQQELEKVCVRVRSGMTFQRFIVIISILV
jgi:hypothetical protein